MTPFVIRRAELRDASAIADLLQALNHFSALKGMPLEAIRAQVDRNLDRCLADGSHTVYVAEAAYGTIAAYAAVHWLPYLFLPGLEGYVSELFVDEAARGQEVGTQLLEVVKQEAAGRGCSRLSLLNMRQRESYQRSFYAKRGWEERPEAANFVLRLSPPQDRAP
jgi:GNAT superfamily N-acetyltransferase